MSAANHFNSCRALLRRAAAMGVAAIAAAAAPVQAQSLAGKTIRIIVPYARRDVRHPRPCALRLSVGQSARRHGGGGQQTRRQRCASQRSGRQIGA